MTRDDGHECAEHARHLERLRDPRAHRDDRHDVRQCPTHSFEERTDRSLPIARPDGDRERASSEHRRAYLELFRDDLCDERRGRQGWMREQEPNDGKRWKDRFPPCRLLVLGLERRLDLALVLLAKTETTPDEEHRHADHERDEHTRSELDDEDR